MHNNRKKRGKGTLFYWLMPALFLAGGIEQIPARPMTAVEIVLDERLDEGHVTIHMTNVPLERILNQLKAQTGIEFGFNSSDIRTQRFSLPVEKVTLREALDVLMVGCGNRLRYVIRDNRVMILPRTETDTVPADAEDQMLRGMVLDRKKQPIVGVSIVVKGTTTGVTTDSQGFYQIRLPRNATLRFTFIGMKPVERLYTGQKLLNVEMEEAETSVDEVVVTGYQVVNKRKSTSATTSVRAEDIRIPGMLTIDRMLEGQIPDLMLTTNSGEVGVAPKIRIRGTSTLIGNREPLWVLDGIVLQDPVAISPEELNNPDYINRIGNAIAGINPQDIERIDVLKDAAATALYGTKAANGVIVITTKKGHVGKPVVNYNFTGSFKLRPRYSDRKIDLMTASERLAFSKELVDNGYTISSSSSLVGYEGLVNRLYSGAIDYDQFAAEYRRLEELNTDWFDLLTEDSFSHQHTVSLSGGSENIRYYSSVGYARDNDVIKNNFNERYTATLNLNTVLSSRISADFGIKGNVNTRRYNQEEIAPLDYAYNTSRAIPAYDENGDYYFYSKTMNSIVGYDYNVLNELENSSVDQNGSSIAINLRLNGNLTDWLRASLIGSYSTSATDIEGWWGEKSYHVAALRLSNYGDPAPSGSESQSLLPFGGELSQTNARTTTYMARFQLDMNKYIDAERNHLLDGSLGFEVNSTRYRSSVATYRGYYRDRGKQFSKPELDDYPYYKDWLADNAYPTIVDNLTNVLSGYATLSYSYKEYFTLNANARFDGSNKFGDQSNEKLLPVWSVSGNYNLAAHDALRRDWIDYLLLKVSYGLQGNMLDDQSPVMIISQQPIDPVYNELVAKVDTYPNPNLKWEKTSSFNAGLTFSLFGGRLQTETDFYHKKTRDAFLSKRISSVNGIDEYVVNSGDVTNYGFSIALTAIPIRTKDFSWILATNFSKSYNRMNTRPGEEQYELENFLNGTALVEGQPVGTFYSYRFLGLNPTNGEPLFDDWEDRQDELKGLTKYECYTRVLTPSGTREPTISGMLSNTLRYRNWRLNLNLTYSLGSKIRRFKLFESTLFSPVMNIPAEFNNRWRKPGDELTTNIPNPDCYRSHYSSSSSMNNEMPIIAYNNMDMYNYSDIRVVSGDYLKCSTVGLTYEFASEKIARWGMSRLAVNLAANNLFTICSPELRGQTPQQSGFAQIELTDRPMFTVSLDISF